MRDLSEMVLGYLHNKRSLTPAELDICYLGGINRIFSEEDVLTLPKFQTILERHFPQFLILPFYPTDDVECKRMWFVAEDFEIPPSSVTNIHYAVIATSCANMSGKYFLQLWHDCLGFHQNDETKTLQTLTILCFLAARIVNVTGRMWMQYVVLFHLVVNPQCLQVHANTDLHAQLRASLAGDEPWPSWFLQEEQECRSIWSNKWNVPERSNSEQHKCQTYLAQRLDPCGVKLLPFSLFFAKSHIKEKMLDCRKMVRETIPIADAMVFDVL